MYSLAAALSGYLLPGVHIDDFITAVIFSLVMAFLNAFLKPILLIITLPFTIVTFGFFLLIINAFVIMLADYLVAGFAVDGFWWALAFSLLLSFVVSIFNKLDKDKRPRNQNSFEETNRLD